jgi:hypothetical protein
VFPLQRRMATSRGRADVTADPGNPHGVELTFGALSVRRIGVFGSPSPLRPLAGPWGLPSHRRPRPGCPDLHASLPWPSPLLQGFHPRLPVVRPPSRAGARRASPGVRCPSALDGSTGPHARDFQLPLRSTLRVSTLSAACSPRTLPALFHAGALMGFSPSGGFSSEPVGTPYGARHLHDVGRPPSAPLQRPGPCPSEATIRKPVHEASRARNPCRSRGCYPAWYGRIPSWASSFLGFLRHRTRRPDLAAIPPWASRRPSRLRAAAAPALRGFRHPTTWLDSGSRATPSRFFPFCERACSFG